MYGKQLTSFPYTFLPWGAFEYAAPLLQPEMVLIQGEHHPLTLLLYKLAVSLLLEGMQVWCVFLSSREVSPGNGVLLTRVLEASCSPISRCNFMEAFSPFLLNI